MPRFRRLDPVGLEVRPNGIDKFDAGFMAAGKGPNILVIRDTGLGDVLYALSVVGAMSRKYKTKISFATNKPWMRLAKKYDFIKYVRLTPEKVDGLNKHYDLIIDLRNAVDFLEQNSKGHRLDILADICRVDMSASDKNLQLPISVSERKWASSFLKNHKCAGKTVVGVHTDSISPIRSWEYGIDLANSLIAYGKGTITVILFDGRENIEYKYFTPKNAIDTSGKLNTSQLVSLIHACDFFICPDSGPMHVAARVGTPFVALFGPINPDFRLRYYKTPHEVIYHSEIPCVPCWDWAARACAYQMNFKKCMRSIDVKEVISHFERLRKRVQ